MYALIIHLHSNRHCKLMLIALYNKGTIKISSDNIMCVVVPQLFHLDTYFPKKCESLLFRYHTGKQPQKQTSPKHVLKNAHPFFIIPLICKLHLATRFYKLIQKCVNPIQINR